MSNRLTDSTSPYLLQHADNPVDWYPWGPEALERARQEDKPIFLSIGYAACHWCHVMEHESFEDPDTAALMNQHFVNIKVDREQRPDLDSLYMDAVVAMTGQGGWPMSVFLTPDGKPFYGGTYFPPTRRFNMPGFPEILQALADKWENDREEIHKVGDQLAERLGDTPALQSATAEIDPAVFDRAAETLFRSYDWQHGGWGQAPKFPQPMAVEFLLRRHKRSGDQLAADMALHALRTMAAGGMHDQLAGGFARYSVDDRWLVPHFEKMLYDNAQLARAYLQGWQVSDDPELLRVCRRTLDWMLRELRHPEGGLFSSYDADSEGEEGKYYVWTTAQIDEALDDDELSALFRQAYGVTEAGNFEGRNVLYRAVEAGALAEQHSLSIEQVESQLERARVTLLERRQARVPPGLDDKVLTAWNSLGLTALAEAARAIPEPGYLAAAQQLADFLLQNLQLEGRLLRSWRDGRASLTAYLEDHAALGLGLLALYQSDFDPRWYAAAVEQAGQIVEAFSDPQGGFFDTRDDHEQLIARPKSLQDSPTSSGNTLAVRLLLTLGAYEGDQRYLEPAEQALRAMIPTASQHPAAFAGWLSALDFALGPQHQLAVTGDPALAQFQALIEVAWQRFLPNLVLAGGDPESEYQPELMTGRTLQDGAPTAYLCQAFACQLPTNSPEQLLAQLESAMNND